MELSNLINAGFTLQVAHLRPAISPQMQVLELQRQFVGMQWERPEEPPFHRDGCDA